jgi:hypothetical protein
LSGPRGPTRYDKFDEAKHVVDVLPPISDWLCVSADYGTTNPLHAQLLGLGVDGTLYLVAEWRWDSRQQGRQMTDVEYSRQLRDWLNTVRLPASNQQRAAYHGQPVQDRLTPLDQ